MIPSIPPAYRAWLAEADADRVSRPQVGLCFAQSLDGSLALERGRPTRLSGPQSARLTHALRAAHDAILVGAGTVLADDPQLTVRHVRGPNPQPVILDSRLRTPPGAFLVAHHPRPAWIAALPEADPARRAALEVAGAQIILLPAAQSVDGAGVSLPALLDSLSGWGVRRLMVEGGAQVITRFLVEGLADWVCITLAPCFIGGLRALEARLPALPRLQDVIYQTLDDDLVIWGRLSAAHNL